MRAPRHIRYPSWLLIAALLAESLLGYAPSARAQVGPPGSDAVVALRTGFEVLTHALARVERDLRARWAQEGSAAEDSAAEAPMRSFAERSRAFGLADQHLLASTPRGAVNHWELSDPLTTPPRIVVADFDRQVRVESDPASGALQFVYEHEGERFVHQLRSIRVRSIARDREWITVLTRDDELLLLDVGHARIAAFQGPLPSFYVGRLRPATTAGLEGLRVAWIHTGGEAAVELSPRADDAALPLDRMRIEAGRAELRAGDLAVLEGPTQAPRLLAIRDREVMTAQALRDQIWLAGLVDLVQGAPLAAAVRVSGEAVDSEGAEETVGTLAAVPPASRALIAQRRTQALTQADRTVSPLRQQLSLQEWQQAHRDARETAHEIAREIDEQRALVELGAPVPSGQNARAVIASRLTHLREQVVARGRAWGPQAHARWQRIRDQFQSRLRLKLAGAGMQVLAQAAREMGAPVLAWVSARQYVAQFAMYAYDHFFPDVLRDAAYRVTLLQSNLYLSAGLPLYWALGAVGAAVLATRSGREHALSSYQVLMRMGMRPFAELSLPIWHRAIAVARTFTPEATLIARTRAARAARFATLRRGLDRPFDAPPPPLRERIAQTLERRRVALAEYGLREYTYLRRATPSRGLSVYNFRLLVVDYLLCVLEMGIIGARADRTRPDELAALATGPLKTNPKHFADILDLMRVYALNEPARLALVTLLQPDVRETAYDARSLIEPRAYERREPLFAALGAMFGHALDLPRADYARLEMRNIAARFATLQAGFAISLVMRVWVANQPMSDAIPAFVYTTALGLWAYGWVWGPLMQAMFFYEQERESDLERWIDARARTAQAWITKRSEDLRAGLERVLLEYEQSKLSDVGLRLEAGRARAQLAERSSEELLTLGEQWLEQAHALPPVYTAQSESAKNLATLAVAVASIYLGAELTVYSFREGVDWPAALKRAIPGSALGYALLWQMQRRVVDPYWYRGVNACARLIGLPAPYAAERLPTARK